MLLSLPNKESFSTSFLSITITKICRKTYYIAEETLFFPKLFSLLECINKYTLHWPTMKLNCTRKRNVIFLNIGKLHNVQIFVQVFKYSILCCFFTWNHSTIFANKVCYRTTVSKDTNFLFNNLFYIKRY